MASIDGATLSEKHLEALRESAISDRQIATRGYHTIISGRLLPAAFVGPQRELHGLVIPVRNTLGEISTYQLRPDNPRTCKDGKPIRYETAIDGRVCLDVPAAARPVLRDVHTTLWVTEGAKKVDSAVSHGIPCTIGFLGVWMWRGDRVALPDWNDIALKGRNVVIAFDSDVMTKDSVRGALDSLSSWLSYRGAIVRYCLLPDLPDGTKCGLDDYLAAGHTLANLEAQVVDALPAAERDWQEPIPFDDPTGPPFPLDALPHHLRRYVSAVAEDTGVPVDLAAWCALATIGAATRGRYVVSPKPTWLEPVHIQSLQVLASGGGKSPAYRLITEPLMRWDAQQAEDARQRLISWKVKEKRLLAAERQAQKEADRQGAGADAQLALEAVQLEIFKHVESKPIPQHIIVNDITPQAIWKFLYRQHGSGAAIHAEGGFLRNISRYSDMPVFDPILEGFSGDPHDLRRAGDEDDAGKVIPRPIFAISLAVQPQVLEDMGRLRGFRELGVSARLLTTFPRPEPARSDLSDSVPADLQRWWGRRILAIVDKTDATTYSPGTLALSAEARTAFEDEYAWYARAEADGVFQDMEEWGRKYRGQVLRIAGTLHVLEDPEPLKASISGENMRRAITIMRHAIEHARIGHGIMLGLGTQSNERFVLGVVDALLDTGQPQPITSAQIYDRVRGRYAFRKSHRVIGILRTLEEHRFVRLIPREGPGPRSYTVLRNPLRSGRDNAELASGSSGSDSAGLEREAISHLRTYAKEQEHLRLLTMEPTEPLEPTGTDGNGTQPGEIPL